MVTEHSQDPDEEVGYIYVVGGPALQNGQVAIAEVDPKHPYLPPINDMRSGEHQAYVVKGDPKCGGAWVGRTSEVSLRLGRGMLKEAKAPSGTPAPLDGPETESSARARKIRESKERVGSQPVDGNPVDTGKTGEEPPTGEAGPANAETEGPSENPVVASEATATRRARANNS